MAANGEGLMPDSVLDPEGGLCLAPLARRRLEPTFGRRNQCYRQTSLFNSHARSAP